ncbi:hypothetical protein DUNSADRAFT_12458 [Dunaliella salina]|uniref:Phytanoyl-CoA dioxygenase n=1 Tax=Dunaliella salina TaxID=3046 RepID=A0ABQ7H3T9_DUNSA|nr:hypothetical protein DUNSADRAFT_12458 [Dunaliella salina]|eukprot:KAF5841530.1 hypothetical protein DUNSADRAFT_12458 [Dunaliella salina]
MLVSGSVRCFGQQQLRPLSPRPLARPTPVIRPAASSTEAEAAMEIPETFREAYRKEGFVHIPNVLSEEEMSSLIDPAYYAFLRGDIKVPEKDVCDLGAAGNRKHVAPALVSINSARNHHPAWKGSALEKKCESLAEQLMEAEDVELDFDQIQAKRPSCRDSVLPWFQERAYLPEGLPEECENSVSFWLAVTDVPVEAGCLRFIPGSHLSDLRRHTAVRAPANEEEAAQQAEVDVPRALKALVGKGERAALVPIQRGDIVAHSDRVVHGSGPNLSSQWRCSYLINFKRVGCVVTERSLGIENPFSQPVGDRN